MPILRLVEQRRQAQVGRIRIGTSEPTGRKDRNGKPITRPVKLDSYRFTSGDKRLIEAVAAMYGGEVRPWTPQRGGSRSQFEVVTGAKEITVIVPPNPVSQWFELWGGKGCERRCDGVTDTISGKPCLCPMNDRGRPQPNDVQRQVCSMKLRISLILAGIPGMGAWRLDSGGENANVELPGTLEMLESTRGYLPGRLWLDERVRSGGGTFFVPVLDADIMVSNYMLTGNLADAIDAARALQPADRVAIAAAPEPPAPTPAVTAEQIRKVAAATTDPQVLRELWERARDNDVLDAETAEFLKARAASPPPVPAEPVVDAEIVPDGEWPEVRVPRDD